MPELKNVLFEEPGQRKLVARPFIMPKKPHRKRRTLKPRTNISPVGELGYIAPLEETEAIPLDRMIEMIVAGVTEKQNPFGVTLSRLRCQFELTQRQLGELVGIPNSLISHYETGFGFPSVARIIRIGKALKEGEEEIYSSWVEEYNRRASQPIVSDSEVQMSCINPSVLEQVMDESANPLEYASRQILKEEVDDVLRTLTHRERRVIQLRFGLDDGREWTLGAIGAEFGVTTESIRYIEARALQKLRHPSRTKKFRDYFDVSSEFNYIDYVDRPGSHGGWFNRRQIGDEPLTAHWGPAKKREQAIGDIVTQPRSNVTTAREEDIEPEVTDSFKIKEIESREEVHEDEVGVKARLQAESLFYLEEITKSVDPVYLYWWRQKELAYYKSLFEFLAKGESPREAKRLAREEQEIWLSENLAPKLQKYPHLAPLYGIDFK